MSKLRFLMEVRRDRIIDHAAYHQRMAVGRASRQRRPADRAAGARLVVDYDGLPDLGRYALGKSTGNGVDAAARRIGCDHADLLGRPRLSLRDGRCGQGDGGRRQQPAAGQQ
jgi:hypothetical protein